ncbi:MAG: flippase-like domain-containing protein, partial [Promicromonosporaceae bacterium]|nr:flippase-like domain-containing protein [Promicromonosporaceae bacterium]
AAHRAGLAHRQLTKDAVLVEDGRVWIVDWQYGETNASQLSRRLDLTQMLTLLALRIGVQPAVTSAVQMLPRAEIEAIGPLLQSAALPPETRAEVRRNKGFLGELRQAFAAELPEAQTEPAQIARFSPRSLVMLALTIVAVVVVVTTINFEQIAAAVRAANPWWIAVSFILAALPWLGAAMPLVAFAPGRLPLLPAVEVQVASSFVALAAPVGIGPAGVNLRFLNRRGIATPVALATITLVQLMQVAVSVALLAALLLIEGPDGMIAAPSATVRIAIVAMFALVAVLLLVPPVRRFAWAKARPTLVQVWPRLLATVGQPKRLALGLSGNLIHALAYVFSFYAVLLAFNHTLPLVDVAIIYLVGNTVGALAPTPGGLGGVEGALIAGLSAAGIPAAIAMSVTMLFRVVSYWIQAPIGWVAMRHAQHTGDL